jgi:hypothetical protein
MSYCRKCWIRHNETHCPSCGRKVPVVTKNVKGYNKKLLAMIEKRYGNIVGFSFSHGISSTMIGRTIRNELLPIKNGEPSSTALKIAQALNEDFSTLFPEYKYGKLIKQPELNPTKYISRTMPSSMSAEDIVAMSELRKTLIEVATSVLTHKQASILLSRIGIKDGVPMTIREIAESRGITYQAVQQSLDISLRTIRGSGQAKHLLPFLDTLVSRGLGEVS